MTDRETSSDLTAQSDEEDTSCPVMRQRPARRFISFEETAALLEVSEDVLRRWRAIGRGPQPVIRPEGRLYVADQIEYLASLPRSRRLLAIGRVTCLFLTPRR